MKILFSFLLVATFGFALEFDKIDTTMEKNINQTIHILQTSNKNIESIAKEIFAMFDSIFDYHLMAQLSLSKKYKTLSPSQQKEFDVAFEKNLKRSFTDKLHLYKDETMKVLGGQKTKANRYNLKTSIILDGKIHYITFKFHEFNQDWKIYDVDILGISVIQTYRSQFADIISQEGFEKLLQKLESEIRFEN
ncbi:MlaC/ttg2D family ABC transporter substrate-binding protein [Helicobacter pullorum]|uniref:MlaC/ttg2D family ABC transporter substrate-binding protein n=1 Tax=Helicobacter pullorum TaxID=35818 RepID=UPI0006CD24D1|nr:ABC transporter substrate-binding protein [Helicobacter pullorum]KAB0576053.1 ABC transporter substrate-binding protein [Helicobacter pullorum NCTC 12824]KPH54190.1 toluene tolerance protein [Helicobacter pullorum]OCR04969.1 toluene tolerance protein [Helicobacter pullorum]OCR08527.1 toluene tolerance protein [Helicobacter pullorum]OCR15731.1 toluene tolerance protein [Helicobacter pullorum]